MLLETLESNLKQNGFEVVNEAHALSKSGDKYFGMIEITKPCLDTPDLEVVAKRHSDYGLVIGIRNTHNQQWAAAYAMGNRVLVCDNLSFSGEVLVGRKHTKNIVRDLPLMIPKAFAALGHERVCMETRIDAYKEFAISDKDANDAIVRALVDEKIFPSSYLPHIVNEWRSPSHEEFEPRTVWSLNNAFTEAAKPNPNPKKRSGNLHTLMRRTTNLYGFFDKQIGLSLPTRDELLIGGMEDVVTANDAGLN
jgi:hypothetical protein